MDTFRADLHCHSTASDGTDSPLELVHLAKKLGLNGLSITDHDTTSAYSSELFALADSLSIQIVPGIEISTEFLGESLHILGYHYDLASPSLAAFLKKMQEKRKERCSAILQKLSEKGIELDVRKLDREVIGRPHIAYLLMQKGVVSSIQEAFDRYLKDGASCYVAGFHASPTDAIGEIHAAGGKAILAHPHIYKKWSWLKKVLALPFDGIECYYSIYPKTAELPWVRLAKEKGWIATGGSDYHGAIRPRVSLGASWVGLAAFEALRN